MLPGQMSLKPVSDCEIWLFFVHEVTPEMTQMQDSPISTPEAELSLTGTFAHLFTNTYLTDVSGNISLSPSDTSCIHDKWLVKSIHNHQLLLRV